MSERERQVLTDYQNEIKEYWKLYAESNRIRDRGGKDEE